MANHSDIEDDPVCAVSNNESKSVATLKELEVNAKHNIFQFKAIDLNMCTCIG